MLDEGPKEDTRDPKLLLRVFVEETVVVVVVIVVVVVLREGGKGEHGIGDC